MTSTYKVSYTPEAEEDLRQIVENLLGTTWPRSVEKWLNKILNKADSLATFPEGNSIYEYDNRFRSVKVGKYRIIYEVHKKAKVVSILRIIYARRNLKEITIKNK